MGDSVLWSTAAATQLVAPHCSLLVCVGGSWGGEVGVHKGKKANRGGLTPMCICAMAELWCYKDSVGCGGEWRTLEEWAPTCHLAFLTTMSPVCPPLPKRPSSTPFCGSIPTEF